MTLGTAPHGQRRPPVALARQRPVDVALEPFPEAPVLDVLGVPGHGLVGGEQAVAQPLGAQVPGGLGVIEQRRAAAPAVRVGMLVLLGAQQPPARAQVLDQVGVGVLDEAPGERADALVVGSVAEHRVHHGQALLLAQAEVVLAEGDRRVDQTGAVVGGDEVTRQDGVAALAVGLRRDEREGRLVAGALDAGAVELVEDLGVLAEHALHERGSDDVDLPARHTRAHVGHRRVDGHRSVGDQRPRGRRPHQQLVPRLQWCLRVDHSEAHVDTGVDHVAVAERDLVRGQRRAAPRAVGDHLVALVEQTLLPHLRERPPDRLDVARVQRAVGVVEVDPEADPLGQPVPVLQELEHRLAALRVEGGDPVLLDLRLGRDPELLLDGDLHRQPVAVPAALALDVVAAHRLVARVDVLEHPREDVVGARAPVRGRRALVEHPRLRALAPAHGLVEDVALAPALQHLELEGREGLLGIDGTVRCHAAFHSTNARAAAARCRPGYALVSLGRAWSADAASRSAALSSSRAMSASRACTGVLPRRRTVLAPVSGRASR